MNRRRTKHLRLERVAGKRDERSDSVATEEPMEIRLEWPDREGVLNETPVAVTMRTPGDDFDLAAGFLLTEGVVSTRAAIERIRYCANVSPQEYNVVTVELGDAAAFDPTSLARNFYITSSCGVCGKASLEAVANLGCESLKALAMQVPAPVVRSLPTELRRSQPVFQATGGIHAAAAFDEAGTLIVSREDVGRHNAVDKVVGALAMRSRGVSAVFPGRPHAVFPGRSHAVSPGRSHAYDRPDADDSAGAAAASLGLMVSGRASFEIMQKAAMARMPVVVAVGAPSSLAVQFAREFDMTLAGFANRASFNIYSRADRIVSSGEDAGTAGP